MLFKEKHIESAPAWRFCSLFYSVISSLSVAEVSWIGRGFLVFFDRGWPLTYLYLRRHSPGAGWAGKTNCVDHVSDGGTPGSTVLRELTRHFHPVLSLSCVTEDSRSGERFQIGLNSDCPRLQLASSSFAPRARWCGKEKVLDQLTFRTSCS